MITELRYVGNFLLVFCGAIAALVVSVAVAVFAHVGAIGAVVVFFALGGAAAIIAVRRRMRTATSSVLTAQAQARYAPVFVDLLLLGWFAYSLVTMALDLSKGNHVSNDTLIINGGLFAWWLVNTIRDIKRGLPGQHSNAAIFSGRKLAAFDAAYALPPGAERRRALAPLRNRGLARLALLLGLLILIFAFAPHFGIGVGTLVALTVVAATFLILHKLIDL